MHIEQPHDNGISNPIRNALCTMTTCSAPGILQRHASYAFAVCIIIPLMIFTTISPIYSVADLEMKEFGWPAINS